MSPIDFLSRYFPGGWFGTFFTFPYIGSFIIPIDFHIFRGVAPPPTSFQMVVLTRISEIVTQQALTISSCSSDPRDFFHKLQSKPVVQPIEQRFNTLFTMLKPFLFPMKNPYVSWENLVFSWLKPSFWYEVSPFLLPRETSDQFPAVP